MIVTGAAYMYEELKQIIRSVLQQGLSGQQLMGALTANFNPAEIYASDDMLVTDSYFSLLHFGFESRLPGGTVHGVTARGERGNGREILLF